MTSAADLRKWCLQRWVWTTMLECHLSLPKALHTQSGKKSKWLSRTGSTGANDYELSFKGLAKLKKKQQNILFT